MRADLELNGKEMNIYFIYQPSGVIAPVEGSCSTFVETYGFFFFFLWGAKKEKEKENDKKREKEKKKRKYSFFLQVAEMKFFLV